MNTVVNVVGFPFVLVSKGMDRISPRAYARILVLLLVGIAGLAVYTHGLK